MKKRYKVFSFAGVILVLLAGWYIYVSNLPAFYCNEKMLTDNEKEYTLIAKTIYEDYKEHKNSEYNIYFVNKNHKRIKRIRGNSEKEFLEIDDNVRAAIVVVCDRFSLGNQPLECFMYRQTLKTI